VTDGATLPEALADDPRYEAVRLDLRTRLQAWQKQVSDSLAQP
jgi:hypothetical protein